MQVATMLPAPVLPRGRVWHQGNQGHSKCTARGRRAAAVAVADLQPPRRVELGAQPLAQGLRDEEDESSLDAPRILYYANSNGSGPAARCGVLSSRHTRGAASTLGCDPSWRPQMCRSALVMMILVVHVVPSWGTKGFIGATSCLDLGSLQAQDVPPKGTKCGQKVHPSRPWAPRGPSL